MTSIIKSLCDRADAGDYHGAEKRRPEDLPSLRATGPVTALDRREHRARVLAGLDALSGDYRQVLLLRFFEGYNSDEAGRRMGRSAGAIRKLTVRALAALGESL